MQGGCKHVGLNWRAASDKREALNEEAWECLDCGAVLGFRPDFDRSYTQGKVLCILLDFHNSGLIYVSNSDMGQFIAANVAAQCKLENRFDQWSILTFILSDPNMAGHGEYWAGRAEQWLANGESVSKEQEASLF